MTTLFVRSSAVLLLAVVATCATAFLGGPVVGTPEAPSYEDLRLLDQRLQRTVDQLTPATVAVHAYVGRYQATGGVGSGVFIDSRGLVLTCAHVIGSSTNIKVQTHDGETFPVEVLGSSKRGDYALLAIPEALVPEGGFSAAVTRDIAAEPLELGEWVVALGHPGGPNMDRVPAASIGRITGRGVHLPRELGTRVRGGLLQTDLPITSGSSGGPLLDVSGRLLGINNAVSLIDERAFAIPYPALEGRVRTWSTPVLATEPEEERDAPAELVSEPASQEPESRGYLGVRLRNLSGDELEFTGSLQRLGFEGGVLITGVAPGDAADVAGFEPGDLLVSFGGRTVVHEREAAEVIAQCTPGENRVAIVLRGSTVKLLRVQVGARPAEERMP